MRTSAAGGKAPARAARRRARSGSTVSAMDRVFVGVGSSLSPAESVPRALERLDAAAGIVAVSTFHRTPALHRPADPPFANGVVEVRPDLGPAELRAARRAVEEGCGRRRGADRWAPRTIDLDLLLHGETVSRDPPLPHPDVTQRRFVALPLLELCPDLVLPGGGPRLAAVAAGLPASPMEPLPELTRSLRERFGRPPLPAR